MRNFVSRSAVFAIVIGASLTWSLGLSAQWLKYPTAGVPRTSDGTPNLTAPTPRLADGHPDFSGIWLTADTMCGGRQQDPESLTCGQELPMGLHGINMGMGLAGGLPYQ